MVPKNVFRNGLAAMTCIMLLAWSGTSIADEYRPDEYLGLDLSRAVLSPKRLGPDARIRAGSDRGTGRSRALDGPRRTRHADQGSHCASARGAAARRSPHQAGAAARQSARCAGVGYADSGLAVQVRRYLQLEGDRAPARSGASSQRVTNR